MLVKDKLKTTQFSSSDKYIADYFLEAKDNIKDLSIRDIASIIYCSPSTIHRFTKRMGYNGFNDFKQQYLSELNYLESHFKDIDANKPFEIEDTPTTIASKIETLYKETIEDNKTLLDKKQLTKAIELLTHYKNISIVTSSSQIGIAYSFKDKCIKIGKKVYIHTTSDEAYYDATYSNDTCFILISYSGETSRCLKVARKLNSRNIPFLSITTLGNNTLSQLSSNILYVSTREKLIDNLGSFSMNISTLYLLDTLYACFFNTDYNKHIENKKACSKEYENIQEYLGRTSNNPILK